MEPFAVVLVAALVGSVVYLVASEQARARARAWRAAAQKAGLTGIQETETLGLPSRLTGQLGRLTVQLERFQRGKHQHGTRITVRGLGHGPYGLAVRREGFATAFDKVMGGREIEIGDRAFDAELYVQGPAPLARALLDAPTRRELAALLQGEIALADGRRVDASVRLAGDALQAEIPEKPFRPPPAVSELLGRMLAVAARLETPPDIPRRIADNLRTEPDDGVRLQGLLMLVREFHADPATHEALLAAREDRSDEIRLRAGMALGDEGTDVLVDLLAPGRADDACAARAVEGLGERLETDRTRAVLEESRHAGRALTARACLERLGRSGGDAVVGTLGEVLLAPERDELRIAAAAALGATGVATAEEPLVSALAGSPAEVCAAVAEALGRMGSARAVPALHEAAARHDRDKALGRAVRQAVASIQSRLEGAEPGQLSLAAGAGEAGQLSLAPEEASGRLSLKDPEAEEENEEEKETPRAQRPGITQGVK